MIHILQIVKKYVGKYPLFDEMFNLDRERFRLVVCYLGGEKSGVHALEDRVHRIVYLDKSSSQMRWYNLPLLKTVSDIIDQEKIDIVCCQLHRTLPVGLGSCLLSRRNPALVSTIHGLVGQTRWVRKMQNRVMHRSVDRVIAISHAVNKDIQRNNPWLPKEKVVTIHNGLDFSDFNIVETKTSLRQGLFPKIRESFWFGTVGRLSSVKNHGCLIEAFAKFVQEVPNAALFIAGRGELEATLREKCHVLGVSDKVHFLGFRSDVPQFLRCLDCFVFPSLREGLGLSLLEAMASQLPVVAAAVGGIPEVFPDQPIGRLVEGATAERLANAMLDIAKLSESERCRLGLQARVHALEHFNSKRMISDYEHFFEDLYLTHNNNNK